MDNELRSKCWYKDVCQEDCSSSCIRYLEMAFLMDSSCIPKARQIPTQLIPEDVDYDVFVKLSEIKSNILDVVSSGQNIYIGSETTGNGKTTWAIKLMLKYFDEIWAGNGFRCRGVFVYVPTFLTQLKDFGSKNEKFEQMKRDIQTADLVIWDDIGSAGLSNYDLSQMLTYLDQRILDKKANIFTGNFVGSSLEQAIGTRLYSRVWNTSDKYLLRGHDRRGWYGSTTNT